MIKWEEQKLLYDDMGMFYMQQYLDVFRFSEMNIDYGLMVQGEIER